MIPIVIMSEPLIYNSASWTAAQPVENKTISVTLNCLDRQPSESGQTSEFTETEITNTITLNNVTTSNLDSIAAQAISRYQMNNVYDEYYFNVSQDRSVRKSASGTNALSLLQMMKQSKTMT